MLVRQDKLALIVNFFKVEDVSMPIDKIQFSDRSLLFFQRFGVIINLDGSNKNSEVLNNYIPVNKHYDLNRRVLQFTSDQCGEIPKCSRCDIFDHCDYYNKKNEWID